MISRALEELVNETVEGVILNERKEKIAMKLRKGFTPEQLHEDDEYPIDLILQVQQEMMDRM